MNTTLQQNKIFTAENASTVDDFVKVYPPQMTPSGGWYFYWLVPENLFNEQGSARALPRRLTDPLFGREGLNQRLQEMATAAPSIEQVWEITKKLPSLAKLLSEERDNE